mmetsp:Transcript_8210/g.9386  ORF Transcript_8210/g.9386 Transcript_8210/m.9386 type:complete len:317 (+) Transcript_8210:149-1099(+)
MKSLALLFLIFLVGHSVAWKIERGVKDGKWASARIVGGEIAERGRYPYFVTLAIQANQGKILPLLCGGVLISPTVVLSAGHCNTENLNMVIVGTDDFDNLHNNTEAIAISETIVHPSFDKDTLAYDYMLIKLSSPSSFSPARLDTGSCKSLDGAEATAIGFGSLEAQPLDLSVPKSFPRFLQEVDIVVMSNSECSKYYNGISWQYSLCASAPGKDSCFGDSGGPLIIPGNDYSEDVLIGIVSSGAGCAQTPPGIYSRMGTQYKDFIVPTLASFGIDESSLQIPEKCEPRFVNSGISIRFSWFLFVLCMCLHAMHVI